MLPDKVVLEEIGKIGAVIAARVLATLLAADFHALLLGQFAAEVG